MNLEQLAVIGILVFSFMALTTAFSAIRSAKRRGNINELRRVRRLVGSAESAQAIAKSIVQEIAGNHEEAVAHLRKTGELNDALEKAIGDARSYFLSRVESRYRTIFSKTVDDLIYQNRSTDLTS